MKNKDNLKMVLIIVVIVSLIALLAFLLFRKDDNDNISSNGNSSEKLNISYNDYNSLRDSNVAFTLQKIINGFYESLKIGETKDVLDMLNNNYKLDYNVNSNNLYSILDNNFSDAQVIVNDILYYNNDSINYYLVKSYMYLEKFSETREYVKDLNYFVILDTKSFKFSIYPIVNQDVNLFMNRYDYNKSNELISSYRNVSLTLKNKIRLYITNFLVLLDYDPTEAYEMLGNKTKLYFGSKDNFIRQVSFIKEKVSASAFSYSEEEVNSVITYRIVDDNRNNIIITESSAMNYKIDIEF